MNFRRRLENSDILAALLSSVLANYLRLCFATTRWKTHGLDDLAADLRDGPIVLVLWHSRLLFGPSAWPRRLSRVFTLRDPSPAGRLSSETQTRLGMEPVNMQPNASNFAASRRILSVIRDGHSLGMTADGPLGPAQMAKRAPVEWARATGRPVYVFAWSARRSIHLKTWDRLVLPLPFTRGSYGFQRWKTVVPHKVAPEHYQQLQNGLTDVLNQITTDMDQDAGAARE